MKRFLLFAILVINMSCISYAADNNGIYVAPKISFSVQHARGELDLHTSTWGPKKVFGARAGGALALGYDFRPHFDVPLRVELEYATAEHISKTASIKVRRRPYGFRAKIGVQTILFNAYADIPNRSGFTPYLGAGAGLAVVTTEGRGMGISACCTKTVPAGQVGLGCSYAFNDQIAVDLGYRFVYMGSTRASCDGIRLDLRRNYMHQVLLGLRVMF